MPLDLDKIRALLSSLNAPNGWVYMRDDSAFPCEIRERAGFREVVTLAADPNDLAEAIADMPEMLAALLSELDRLQSDRSMRMERLREELARAETALNALAFAAGVDYGTARADLERAAAGPEIDGVSGPYRYAASLVERAVDRAGRKAEAELRARCLPVVEWRTMLDGRGEIIGWAHDKGSAVLRVAEDRRRADMFPASRVEKPGWVLAFVGEYSYVADSGPETGEAGKAAAVAAWRRVCGLEAANPGA